MFGNYKCLRVSITQRHSEQTTAAGNAGGNNVIVWKWLRLLSDGVA